MAQKMDSASLEDYLRALFELADETGTVHSVEVARSLGVSKPSGIVPSESSQSMGI